MRVTFSGSVPLRVEVLESRVAYFSDEQYSLVRVAPWAKRPIGAAKATMLANRTAVVFPDSQLSYVKPV